MKQTIETIFENGAFRPTRPESVPVPEGQHVRITIEESPEVDVIELAGRVYDGLSEEEIDGIEKIALDRSNFFGRRISE